MSTSAAYFNVLDNKDKRSPCSMYSGVYSSMIAADIRIVGLELGPGHISRLSSDVPDRRPVMG